MQVIEIRIIETTTTTIIIITNNNNIHSVFGELTVTHDEKYLYNDEGDLKATVVCNSHVECTTTLRPAWKEDVQ